MYIFTAMFKMAFLIESGDNSIVIFVSRKSPTSPTERTPKPEYLIGPIRIFDGNNKRSARYMRHGEGTQRWPDGKTYKGYWFGSSFSQRGVTFFC